MIRAARSTILHPRAPTNRSLSFGLGAILSKTHQFHVAAGDWEWERVIGVTARPTRSLRMRLPRPGRGKHRARFGYTSGFTVFAIISQTQDTLCRTEMPTALKSTDTCDRKPRAGRITIA